MGVFAREKVELVAETMARLGVRHGWVVHGTDGLDELTLTGPTTVAEVRNGDTRIHEIVPEQLGLERVRSDALLGAESATGNAEVLEAILAGTDRSPNATARRDVVALNTAACLVVAGVAGDLKDGLRKAMAAIQSGAAASLLERLRAFGRDNATAQIASHPTTSF
jgi:anthranilate phosphoribosyltransferase